jgi:hypothetical protein
VYVAAVVVVVVVVVGRGVRTLLRLAASRDV